MTHLTPYSDELPILDSYAILADAVATCAAITVRRHADPVGGPGDKVFPATYGEVHQDPLDPRSVRKSAPVVEIRRMDGRDVRTVLLNSVPAEAHRHQQELVAAIDEGTIAIPHVRLDFSGTDASDLGVLTSLDVPHRAADALLRDSLDGNQPFGKSPAGQHWQLATPANATPLLATDPGSLIYGLWNSTGAGGGRGAKFARTFVSEIIGLDTVEGLRTSSRSDPARIERVSIYKAKAGAQFDWTADEDEAEKKVEGKGEKKVEKPILYTRGDKTKAGTPAVINHGNVMPLANSGGFTISQALQSATLSCAALRRLKFPLPDGTRLPEADRAGRALLAAISLVSMSRVQHTDPWLRSRCQLIYADAGPVFHVLASGGERAAYRLPPDTAVALFNEAVARAREVGLPWTTEPRVLRPSPALLDLIRRSRAQEIASAGAEDEAATV